MDKEIRPIQDEIVLYQSEDGYQSGETFSVKVEQHRDGAEPNDDLTMMCIRLRAKQSGHQ